MTLLDTLRTRTARKGRSAEVDCGELGPLSVEALSPAEYALWANDNRRLLYAACRELQTCGEQLRKEGKVFRPDEILEYVTQEEAAAAAAVISDISGISNPPLSPEKEPPIPSADPEAERDESTVSSASPAHPFAADSAASPAAGASASAQSAEGSSSFKEASASNALVPESATEKGTGTVAQSEPQAAEHPSALPADSTHSPLLRPARSASEEMPVLSDSAERRALVPTPQLTESSDAAKRGRPENLEDILPDIAESAARILAEELQKAAIVR